MTFLGHKFRNDTAQRVPDESKCNNSDLSCSFRHRLGMAYGSQPSWLGMAYGSQPSGPGMAYGSQPGMPDWPSGVSQASVQF